jgi:hypothetical protein
MKPTPWILPGLALLVTGGWIASQKKSAATLEREITVITGRIHQARSMEDAESKSREAGEKARKENDRKIDWKDLAGKMGQMRNGGIQDMRSMMRMQRMLLDLSAEELCAQLDEIAALDIEDSARKQLQGMILGALVEKSPKLALERFGDQAGDETGGMRWQLGPALRKWAETDPVAAAGWLDKRIAAGIFESKSLDGKSQSLVQFEGSLVGALLKTDAAAATARVAALTDAQREQFFQQGFFFQLQKDSEAAYAKLARDSMPADKVGGILANTAGMVVMNGGFERVDGFIANAHATDDEKKAIVAQVIKNKMSQGHGSKINVDELDKARAWGTSQSPGVVDKATGEALANTLWSGGDFKKASELALKYNESSPNDEVLAAFLKSSQVRHQSTGEAKELIDKIKDPALRKEIANLSEYKK